MRPVDKESIESQLHGGIGGHRPLDSNGALWGWAVLQGATATQLPQLCRSSGAFLT